MESNYGPRGIFIMANFCQNCGAPLQGGPRFCPSCGAQITASSQQAEQSPQNPPAERPAPSMQAPRAQSPYGGRGEQGAPNIYARQAAPAFGAGAGHYVPDEGFSQMFFRYDNRLNRKRYLKRGLALFAMLMLACIVVGGAMGVAGVRDSTIETVGTLMGLACAVPGCMLAVRRLHDLDRPAWWIIGNFIPIVNCVLGLYLLFARGTYGPNQYGPDPLEGQP